MSPVVGLILCAVTFGAGFFLGAGGKLDLILQLVEKDEEIDALNDEADDLANRLVRLSVSPDNVPTCGDAA